MNELTAQELEAVINSARERMDGHEDNLRRCELSGQGHTSYADRQRRQMALFKSALQKLENKQS